MLTKLIESQRSHDVHAGGAAFSLMAHTGLLALAVVVTAHAARVPEHTKLEEIAFTRVEEPKPPEPPKEPPPNAVAVAQLPPKGFQVLTAPVEIPDRIPEVDLTRSVTDEADFSGRGVEGGVARGVVGGTAPVPTADNAYFDFQVEKPVMPRDGNPPPQYPSILEQSRVTGHVLVQFIVDTTGRVDPSTIKVLQSSDALFSTAVLAILPRWRFYAAEAAGHRVRQIVQQPVNFRAP